MVYRPRRSGAQAASRVRPSEVRLTFADGQSKPLGERLAIFAIADVVGEPPRFALGQGSSGVSTIYNAMVAPLGPLQAEGRRLVSGRGRRRKARLRSTAGRVDGELARQFRDPNLPFLIVGLAGWGKPRVPSGRKRLGRADREQQASPSSATRGPLSPAPSTSASPTTSTPRTSRRSAGGSRLPAHRLVYRERRHRRPAAGPRGRPGRRDRRDLHQAAADPERRQCQCVRAVRPSRRNLPLRRRAREGQHRRSSPTTGKPVTRVRYAWADYPIVNLYDLDLLPAPVFEIPSSVIVPRHLL